MNQNQNQVLLSAKDFYDLGQRTEIVTKEFHERIFAMLPAGVEITQLMDLREKPEFVHGRGRFADLPSFCRFVNDFRTSGTRVYYEASKFTAILDGPRSAHALHAPSEDYVVESGDHIADWCNHQATYEVKKTPEWTEWLALAERGGVKQDQLAEFLDDHLAQIAEPAAADFLEAVQKLQLTKDVAYTGILPVTGTLQISYTETVRQKEQNGQVDLPDQFTLVMPVFPEQPPVVVQARLRYTLREGSVTFHVKLFGLVDGKRVSISETLRLAEKALVEAANAELNTDPVYLGAYITMEGYARQ